MKDLKNTKILFVEDDPTLSQPLAGRLTREGFAVTLAQDGEETLQKFQAEKPDLILLDLCLPRQSGFEVLEYLVQQKSPIHAPIIILSNLDGAEDIARAKALGAYDYLVKTKTSHDEILEHIQACLEGKKPDEETH